MAWLYFPLPENGQTLVPREPINELIEACAERELGISTPVPTGKKGVSWGSINQIRSTIADRVASQWWGEITWSSHSSYSVKRYTTGPTRTVGSVLYQNIFSEAFGTSDLTWRYGQSGGGIRRRDLNDIYLVLNKMHTKSIMASGSPYWASRRADLLYLGWFDPASALGYLDNNKQENVGNTSGLFNCNLSNRLSDTQRGTQVGAGALECGPAAMTTLYYSHSKATDVYVPIEVYHRRVTVRNGSWSYSAPSQNYNIQLRKGAIPWTFNSMMTGGTQVTTVPLSGLLNPGYRLVRFGAAALNYNTWWALSEEYSAVSTHLESVWDAHEDEDYNTNHQMWLSLSAIPTTGVYGNAGYGYCPMNYSKLAR